MMGQGRRLTLLFTGREQAVSLVQGSGDIGLPVAGAAASVNTRRSTLLDSSSRNADSEAGNGGDDLCLNFVSMVGLCGMNSIRTFAAYLGADHFERWKSLEKKRLRKRAGLIARG
jgi:hypothetical protein